MYCLFNDAFHSSDYTASNDMTINKEVRNDVQGKDHTPTDGTTAETAWRQQGKSRDIQNYRYLGWYLNPGRPTYEARELRFDGDNQSLWNK